MEEGRPTDYKPEFCVDVDVYILNNQDVWGEFHKTRGVNSDGYERIVKVNLPTREGFAARLGFPRQTLDNWSKDHVEFFDALKKIDAEQKQRLIQEGLAGNYNSTIAKLLLSSNHGMAEKTESDITSGGEKITGIVIEFVKPKN